MNEVKKSRENISQSDMPRFPLEDALVLAKALRDNFASKGTSPINLAQAINRSPSSSGWRILTGSAIAYGITEGGYNATEIELTTLGDKIVNPTVEGEDSVATLEAAFRPSVLKAFYEKYDGQKLPKEDIGRNVLKQFGVPQERTEEAWKVVIKNAEFLNILTDVSGNQYVQLWTASDEVGKSQASVKREEEDKKIYTTPPPARSVTNSVTMDIIKGELEVVISAELQKRAWSNKDLNEKMLTFFSAGEDLAIEAKKQKPPEAAATG